VTAVARNRFLFPALLAAVVLVDAYALTPIGNAHPAVTGDYQGTSPEAIGLLRDTRRREPSGAFISLSGADPLNLVGVLSPGARLPALTGNRVLYRDGLPVASLVAGEVRFLEQLAPEEQWAARNALLRRQVPAVLRVLS